MELFDKKFVYFEWDGALKGKQVLASDNLQCMRRDINDGTAKLRCVEGSSSRDKLYPFKDDRGTLWALVYYDPLYDVKLAWKNGKQIQARSVLYKDAEWIDSKYPHFDDTCCEFRVKHDEYRIVRCPDGKVNVCECDNMPCYAEDFRGTKEQCLGYAAEHYCQLCERFNDNCSTDGACMGFIRKKKWRPFKNIRELKDTWSDKAGMSADYEEPLIWIRDKKRPDITRLITGFNGGSKCVAIAGEWRIFEALFDEYEFLDGTPCGVVEE